MDFYSQKSNLAQRRANGTAKTIPELSKFKKNNIKKYEDPSGIMSSRQFQFATWYVKNRIVIYRVLVGVLIFISACTVLYSLLRIAWILIVEVPHDEKVAAQLVNFEDYQRINQALMPQPLLVGSPEVFVAGVGKFDVFAKVSNPNSKHIVYFDYYFSINGITSEKKSGFLLPQETKPLPILGLAQNVGAVLMLENVSYKRINAHLYTDPAGYMAERNNFQVENLDFKSVWHPQGANANIIKFDLINNSAFNYYDPHFIVEFKNGNTTVGVAEINIEKFESRQRKNIDLRSFADNLVVDGVVIYPSINYFSRSEYFEPVR